MTAYERLRDALLTAGRAVRDSGHGRLTAQCPTHDDANPSLSVTAIEGSALLYCHAGCDTGAVLDALGLGPADLFDTPRGAEYVYPGGRRVLRTPAKSFPQSGNKADRSLFRADRMPGAGHVLVVEGEKDCLAAEAVGAVAVCSAMGAGKAHLADWTPLRGRDVSVVADKDPAGDKHAAQVVEQLRAVGAASVRVVRAAVGKDLADHIAAGHTLEELVTEKLPEPLPRVSLTRLADVQPETVSWLWNGYLPQGKLVTLDGDPGLGKSTLALNLAGPVTTGEMWPDGTRCEHPGAVLLLSAEDGLADTVRPRLDAAGADVSKVHAVEGVPVAEESGEIVLRPPNLADISALAEAVTSTGAVLLIVDVVMAYLPTGTDAHKDQDVRRVLSRLSALADRTGCTVLLIRHLNKASGRDPLYRGGGSIGIVGAARAGLLVASDPEDDGLRVLASVKSNLGQTPPSLSYRLESSGDYGVARVALQGAVEHTAHTLLSERRDPEETTATSEAQLWLEDYLTQHPSALSAEVKREAAKVKIPERTLQRASEKLGIVTRSKGFPRVTWWALPSSASALDDDPDSQKPGATGATGPEQPKQVGATEQEPQSRQPPRDGATVPPGGVTASTPGQTGRVAIALANAQAAAAADAQNAAYRAGLCIDCRTAPQSAGRPRCNGCHSAWLTAQASNGVFV